MSQRYGQKDDVAGPSKHVFGIIGTLIVLAVAAGIAYYLNQPAHPSNPAVQTVAASNAS
ncbi:hypothetical protein BH11PAT2_BH11PAT2_00340 [soil metagenome]